MDIVDIEFRPLSNEPVDLWAGRAVTALSDIADELHGSALDALSFAVGGALAHSHPAQEEGRQFTHEEVVALWDESNEIARQAAHDFVDRFFDDEDAQFKEAIGE
jgi:hypothetical protein